MIATRLRKKLTHVRRRKCTMQYTRARTFGKDDPDADAGSRHHVGARGCGDGNSFEEGMD